MKDVFMSRKLIEWTSRQAWFVLGLLALLLGLVGVVLPLLPTTPLVILAAFAFSKSSPRFESWLMRHRIFGPIIADWRANGAIAPRYKAIAVSMMAGVFLVSLILSVPGAVPGHSGCRSGTSGLVCSQPTKWLQLIEKSARAGGAFSAWLEICVERLLRWRPEKVRS